MATAAVPELSVDGVQVGEGTDADSTASFTVRLSAKAASPVTVDYRTSDGTATGNDYRARAGTLTFKPGQTQRTISVPVVGDTVNEDDESFALVLSNPVNATLATARATALIQNDDARPSQDEILAAPILETIMRGCDVLDTAHCLFPFPSDHFTISALPHSPQSVERGGTGRRLALRSAGMPRNIAGRPIDPTEWNRNDGFSPGTLIATYVDGLSLEATYGLPHEQIGITNPALSQTSAANPRPHILVLEVPAAPEAPRPREHLVWAEHDANANLLAQYEGTVVDQPQGGKAALLIRPAQNFREGRRYVVVLRDLKHADGSAIAANPAFAVCRDRAGSLLPQLVDRCTGLEDRVFNVLDAAGIARDDSLYLAWSFTVASTNNQIGRLRHMRDDAFASLSGDPARDDCTLYRDGAPCRTPGFTIDRVITSGLKDGIAKRIEGTITVPSYVIPADPSPGEAGAITALIDQIRAVFGDQADDVVSALGIGQGASAPPDRLFYKAGNNPADPQSLVYGDGLPDRVPGATMNTRFMCQIPTQATPDAPARAGVYGHGLLDSREAITYDGVPELSREFNYMFCAVDWFGFATGDLPNVASTLVDLSNFPTVPDGSQQGMLNFMFLARLLRDEHGFAARPEFQAGGRPLFDRSDVFYDGNSQGGILGGVLIAADKDITRGALGSLGMNYSTLLTRSKDFDLYSVPLYLSYTDPLDRDIAFSLIQMLWDRSENDGYAAHLTDNSAFGGTPKVVKLDPNFGDQQVSKWTADVMARTMGIPVDRQQTARVAALLGQSQRDPDVVPEFRLKPLDFSSGYQTGRGALIVWDALKDGEFAQIPPTDNVPPRQGVDPHDNSAKHYSGRCQKAHFLRSGGRLIDITAVEFDGAPCPSVPPAPASVATGQAAGGNTLTAIDDSLDGVAAYCHSLAGPADPVCAIFDASGAVMGNAAGGPVGGVQNASCASSTELAGGRSYQVAIPSDSGEVISFQVLEPKQFDCANIARGAHPLIVHGHGFGGSRSTSGFDNYRSAGYAVISIDQRGFGDSSGTVRVMDPDREGHDLVKVLDWAEGNLDYLAWRNEKSHKFVARPADATSVAGGVNLLAGAIGGSYGGGYQLLIHAVDRKDRLDALAPDITWHDLRWSLNPNDVLKTGWDLLLTAGGEAGSYAPGLQAQQGPTRRGLDPYIKEVLARGIATGEFPREALDWFNYHSPSYWCGLNGQPQMPYASNPWAPADPNMMAFQAAGDVPGSDRRNGQPKVDVLLSQGMRDTLFNFNDAWWNYQCLAARGGDVRLVTHQNGHILQDFIDAPDPLAFQNVGGSGNCGTIDRGVATLQWFEEKLHARGPSAALAAVKDSVCISLSDNDAVRIRADKVLAPRAPGFTPGTASYQTLQNVGASSVPQGMLAETLYDAGQVRPVAVPLLKVTGTRKLILAGIPQADFTLSSPALVNDALCSQANVPTLRTGCDAVVFVGLGLRHAGAPEWLLIDDQLTPVRGIGSHAGVSLIGIGERLRPGDQLALLIYGYHPQYLGSFSRDASVPVVNVTATTLQLPLYTAYGSGQPNYGVDAAGSLTLLAPASTCTNPDAPTIDPQCVATGTAAHVVRTLCDYQWLPGVCDQFAHGAPDYQASEEPSPGRPMFQAVGAVHNHSSYSDGDPNAIPRDYYAAARYGHNTPDSGIGDTGVRLDFLISSEHSENEKLPITTSASCVGFYQNPQGFLDALGNQDPSGFVSLLACNHLTDEDHFFKWQATLQQAREATQIDADGNYTGFTGMRGFEWTNDYFNHMNVYFSTNVINAKIDGSYASMDQMYQWLRQPVEVGGGADGLATFNHPGGNPALSPFDGGTPLNDLIEQVKGGANWNDVAYVPAADGHIAAMEVNGGDDIEWYVKALTNGWHLGAVANEDEHQREWASTTKGKTLMWVRGRSPHDYYWAMKKHRTVAINHALVGGLPGNKAKVPVIRYWADGPSVQGGAPLGSIIRDYAQGSHVLHAQLSGLPAGSAVALVSNTGGGQAAPIALGIAGALGAFDGTQQVTAPQYAEDWYFLVVCPAGELHCGANQNYVAVSAPIWIGPGTPVPGGDSGNGSGLISAIGGFFRDLGGVVTALLNGDVGAAAADFQGAVARLGDEIASLLAGSEPSVQQLAQDAAANLAAGNASGLVDDAVSDASALLGLDRDATDAATRAKFARRAAEAVVLTGQSIPTWSAPPAVGLPKPYPAGVPSDTVPIGDNVRNAHHGTLIYPQAGQTLKSGVPVDQIAAYAWRDGAWSEIPVQVDERMPYFLANANSDFAFYSSVDQELSYVWDTESWGMTGGTCSREYDLNGVDDGRNQGVAGPTPDPVPGLDDDDEIAFMAKDAGFLAPLGSVPADVPAGSQAQQVTLVDPLNPQPQATRFVYLFLKPGGSHFRGAPYYVQYARDANADQWIDRSFFADSDPQKIGTSNTGYGPNLHGTVCPDGTDKSARASNDRFPRDGVTVSTDRYQWRATGRWMVREIHVAQPGRPGIYGPDLIDRWKGRAFQQSPDSTISVVGFEDEQVNWEANSTLLGERTGPVRAIREIWGADSGTNVTKTETFYLGAVAYRYHVRVHPIPPDGLYTSWDYNRGAMVPTSAEAAAGIAGGRYFTALRPQGVPIDGINDDVGQIDSVAPIAGQCLSADDGGFVPGNTCPAFFDAADGTFNLPLAFDNWEEISGKGSNGSLVYTFQLKGETSVLSPLVVPYYRDDGCLDDGTGDDPVQRPYPGESSTDGRVIAGYSAANGGTPYVELRCDQKQGAYAQHGVHFFVTGDTDNLFSPVRSTEIDGQQWQFMVPTAEPANIAEPYANLIRAPLQAIVTPRP